MKLQCAILLLCITGLGAVPIRGKNPPSIQDIIANSEVKHLGCFGYDARVKSAVPIRSKKLFNPFSMCFSVCQQDIDTLLFANFTTSYMGLSGENCWCGNALPSEFQRTELPAQCNQECEMKQFKCGGPSAMDVYSFKPWDNKLQLKIFQNPHGDFTPVGCFYEWSRNPIEPARLKMKQMTVTSCYRRCARVQSAYFGVVKGEYCFCESRFLFKTKVPAYACDSSCVADRTYSCGGNYTSLIYKVLRTQEPTPTGNSTYRHVGCFVHFGMCPFHVVIPPALPYNALTSENMTIELCYRECRRIHNRYFGLFGGNQCWCGYRLQYFFRDSKSKVYNLQASRVDCNEDCSGNSSLPCGSKASMDIYEHLAIP